MRYLHTLLCLASFLAPHSLHAQAAKVGERLSAHTFAPLTGHDGRTRLADLYGQPVVIAGFKQHLNDGLNAAWVAKDLLESYAKDGLIVILEDQRAWKNTTLGVRVRAFWMKFFEGAPWMTSNLGDDHPDLPMVREHSQRDVTSLVLVGVDGRLIMEGSAESPSRSEKKTDYRAKFKRAVAEEINRRKKGWGDSPIARKVRAAAFGKGRLGQAWKILQRAQEKQTPDEASELAELAAELSAAFEVRKRQVAFQFDRGHPKAGVASLAALGKSVRGIPQYEEQLRDLQGQPASKVVRVGLKLEQDLNRRLKLVTGRQYAKFGLEGILSVEAFAAKHGQHPVGQRAARMNSLLKHLVAFTKGAVTITTIDAQLEELRSKRRR